LIGLLRKKRVKVELGRDNAESKKSFGATVTVPLLFHS
jgi:hypothetical protein